MLSQVQKFPLRREVSDVPWHKYLVFSSLSTRHSPCFVESDCDEQVFLFDPRSLEGARKIKTLLVKSLLHGQNHYVTTPMLGQLCCDEDKSQTRNCMQSGKFIAERVVSSKLTDPAENSSKTELLLGILIKVFEKIAPLEFRRRYPDADG